MNVRRRVDDRLELLGELYGEVMVLEPVTVKEISRGGVRIETSFPFHVNSLHDFRLSLGSRSIVVKGRLAHCRIGDVRQSIVTYVSGVEFIDPPDRVVAAIDEFIRSIREGRQKKEKGQKPTGEAEDY